MKNAPLPGLPVYAPRTDRGGNEPSTADANLPYGAPTVFSPVGRWMLLAAFVLLLALREPRAWIHGRFLDEEATVFLAYAWHHPWPDALFRSFAGYLNIAANATTLLVATLVKNGVVPLERAPYLTMLMALAVQMQPGVLILTGEARWLSGRLAVIAALLVIAIAPATEEVFLNILHIQFHLALCVGVILALDVPRSLYARLGYSLFLFFAPLCGPGAIILLPLYILRAFVDRSRSRLVQMAPLAAGTAIQMLLFYGSSPMRALFPDAPTVAAAMFVRTIALPALGSRSAQEAGFQIYMSQISGGLGWWTAAGFSALLFGTLIVVAARRRDAAIWLLLSGIGIATASYGFGFVTRNVAALYDVFSGERYNFLPGVLIALGLIALAMRPGFAGRRICAAICGMIILCGAVAYPRPSDDFRDGPEWPQEVAQWRRDHDHPLAVWPRPWTADLSDRAHPCPAINYNKPVWSDAPRYCESGWVSGFLNNPPTGDGRHR